MSRINWGRVLDEARDIIESYDTLVTLRQLFYRLVAALLLPNVLTAYKGLSRVTAEARRDDTFPDLTDRTREIHAYGGYDSPAQALRRLARNYSRDRAEGQPWSVYVGVEKAGMVNQLESWFADYGITILALGGYASQSYVDDIRRHVARHGRPAALFYAGDHDPTGHDIYRDFVERTDCFEQVHRIALGPELVEQYQLPEAVDNDPLTAAKLERDSRARGFVERFGRLTQVELDALPPDVLRGLYEDAIFGDAITPGGFWDMSAYDAVLAREADERAALIAFAESWQD